MNLEAATFQELRVEARRLGVRPARSRAKTIERIQRGPLTADMIAREALKILHENLRFVSALRVRA